MSIKDARNQAGCPLRTGGFSKNQEKNLLYFSKTKKKIYVEMAEEKLKQEDCVKYLGVYLDDRLK